MVNRSVSALSFARRVVIGGFFSVGCLLSAIDYAHAHTIETVAGTTEIAGRPALSISIRPWGVAVAPTGGVYVVDREHSQVLRFFAATNTFSIVAGNTIGGFSGDGGAASAAQLSYPAGLAVDAAGNLFIADVGNGRIRKIDAATGVITTVAGGGWNMGDGVPALSARLEGPGAVTVAADGSIYVVEQDRHRIRRVAANTGLITTVAGSGQWGSSGDGGPAVLAQLARPSEVALDAAGNLFIADQFNHSVRRVDAITGIITRFAGTGAWTWNSPDGLLASETGLAGPVELEFDAQGNLLLLEQDTGRVRKIDAATRIVSSVAMGPGMLQGMALVGNGDLYLTGQNTYQLLHFTIANGQVEAVAGNGWAHNSGDGGPAVLAQMWPQHGVVTAEGHLYLNDNSRIRGVHALTGVVATYAGAGPWGVVGDGGPAIDAFLSYPTALTVDRSGNLFLSDQGMHRIRRVDGATGIITHYAGIGYGYSGDGGPALNAQMRGIRDLATDRTGNLFVIEEGLGRIRRVEASTGIITTVAGNGNFTGPWGDGSLATDVALYPLDAIALDEASNIFFVQHGRIRRIDAATGIITTVAGNGSDLESGDGGPALNAGIQAWAIELDPKGNIFIASLFTNKVRRIDVDTGIIDTVAGNGTAGFDGDGGSATAALLNAPRDLSFDDYGNLYVTEQYRVRRIIGIGELPQSPDSTPPTITPAVNGTLGDDGWYVSNVEVSWVVTDPESPVTSQGCSPTTLQSDSSGIVMTCTATSSGGTSSASVTIKRDATPPTVTVLSPLSETYAYYSNVVASYTCSDALSGVSDCSSAVPNGQLINTTTSGPKLLTVTAQDQAGNTSTSAAEFTVTSQFAFTGFLSPVENPPVINWIRPGGQFAMKWKLPDGRGGYISNTQSVSSITKQTIACPGGNRVPLSESAGPTGLQFNAGTQEFSYRFFTGSGETGCRQVTVRLKDGSMRSALFRFR